jgi:hypothetical protein
MEKLWLERVTSLIDEFLGQDFDSSLLMARDFALAMLKYAFNALVRV